MRRLVSYLIDFALLAAPWSALLGLAFSPSTGNWMSGMAVVAGVGLLATCGTVLLGLLDMILFIKRGRTLGMAATGLIAQGSSGQRFFALVLDPLLLGFAILAASLSVISMRASGGLGDGGTAAIVSLVLIATLALNLIFLRGSERQTLTDVVSGIHVVADTGASQRPWAEQRGMNAVDWLVLVSIGAPMFLVLSDPHLARVSLASLCAVVVLVVLEIRLSKKTGATLGARALAKTAPPSVPKGQA
jgi:hypothetical protein